VSSEAGLGRISADVLDRLLTETGNDHDLVTFVLRAYEDRAPELLAGLQEAVAEGDRREAAQHAHDLASTSGQVGALGISRLAGEIEVLGERGDGPLAEPCARIAAALPEALAELRRIAEGYESSRR